MNIKEYCAFIFFGILVAIVVELLVYSLICITRAILTFTTMADKSIIRKLTKAHICTKEEAEQMLSMIREKASSLGQNVKFTPCSSAAKATGQIIKIPFLYIVECLALNVSDAEKYITYVLWHESAHFIFDKNKHGKCRYPFLPTKRNKFFNWISEVRADFNGKGECMEETLSALKTVKSFETIWDRKKLTREDSEHPSWVRRFEYLKNYSSFDESLWMQIAKDCKYKVAEQDIQKIRATCEKGRIKEYK